MNKDNIKPFGLKLKTINALEIGDSASAHYEIGFQDLAGRTVCTERIVMHVKADSTAVALEISGCIALNPEQALDKLADWLEAYAMVIRCRKPAEVNIPIFR